MKIDYVSGSRADFGLMRQCLSSIDKTKGFDLRILVTGQHLLKSYGYTGKEIKAAQFKIGLAIKTPLSGKSGEEMALALSTQLRGFVEYWAKEPPDLVLLLGDRGEMLAAALAAIHLNIHVGHIHGGEISGTIDDSFRHAISKLSHFHFVATGTAQERLISFGEAPNTIWHIGAPGLVSLHETLLTSIDSEVQKNECMNSNNKNNVIIIYHPVLQETQNLKEQFNTILDLVVKKKCSGIILKPNSDTGGAELDSVLDEQTEQQYFQENFKIVTHMPRDQYIKALCRSDLLIGNSSSGIIESASCNTPCLNIGSRQIGRDKNTNTVDCIDVNLNKLMEAFDQAIKLKGPFDNIYGEGNTDQYLVKVLKGLNLNGKHLSKSLHTLTFKPK